MLIEIFRDYCFKVEGIASYDNTDWKKKIGSFLNRVPIETEESQILRWTRFQLDREYGSVRELGFCETEANRDIFVKVTRPSPDGSLQIDYIEDLAAYQLDTKQGQLLLYEWVNKKEGRVKDRPKIVVHRDGAVSITHFL